jgi:hypothetical protein
MIDKNRSWEPPDGYTLISVDSVGAFLRVTFGQIRHSPGTSVEIGAYEIVIYINDQGREVMRVTGWNSYSFDGQEIDEPAQDWSGRLPDHVKASNRFTASVKFYWEQIKKFFRRIEWHKK